MLRSRKPKTFWLKQSRDTSTTFPARKNARAPTGKATEGATQRWTTAALLVWTSRRVQQRSTLHDVTVKTRETPKGTGNLHEQEAAASSPCRVVGSGPASSAGEWSRPGPATAAAPAGIRVSTPHLPVWGRLTAGVTATAVAGSGRGPPTGRCGVRPEPGPSGPRARAQWSEEEQPPGPSSARPRARAQWKREEAAGGPSSARPRAGAQ